MSCPICVSCRLSYNADGASVATSASCYPSQFPENQQTLYTQPKGSSACPVCSCVNALYSSSAVVPAWPSATYARLSPLYVKLPTEHTTTAVPVVNTSSAYNSTNATEICDHQAVLLVNLRKFRLAQQRGTCHDRYIDVCC